MALENDQVAIFSGPPVADPLLEVYCTNLFSANGIPQRVPDWLPQLVNNRLKGDEDAHRFGDTEVVFHYLTGAMESVQDHNKRIAKLTIGEPGRTRQHSLAKWKSAASREARKFDEGNPKATSDSRKPTAPLPMLESPIAEPLVCLAPKSKAWSMQGVVP